MSPGTATARSHTGGGDTHSPAGWGTGGCHPNLPHWPSAAGWPCSPPDSLPAPLPDHRPPSPCCAGGSAPAAAAAPAAAFPPPGSAPGPAAGAPPLLLRKGRGRGACPGGRGRGERRLEQGQGPRAERGREALPGSLRGAGAAGRGGAPAAPNGIRHGAARARRTARLSRDLAEAAAGGAAEAHEGARQREGQ